VLFKRLATYFDGDALENITSSELLNSGIIDVFLEVLGDSKGRHCPPFMDEVTNILIATSS
jgi:hypothetical protein